MDVEKLIEAGQAFNLSGLGTKKIDFKKWTIESIKEYQKTFALEFMDCFETIPDETDIPKSFGEPYMELVEQFENHTGFFEEKEVVEDDNEVAEPTPSKKQKETNEKGKVKEMKKAKAETKTEVKKVVAKKEAPVKKEKVVKEKKEIPIKGTSKKKESIAYKTFDIIIKNRQSTLKEVIKMVQAKVDTSERNIYVAWNYCQMALNILQKYDLIKNNND